MHVICHFWRIKFPTYQMIFQFLSLYGAILDILTRFEIKLTNEMCRFLSICAHAAVFDMLILAMKISNFRKNEISNLLSIVPGQACKIYHQVRSLDSRGRSRSRESISVVDLTRVAEITFQT